MKKIKEKIREFAVLFAIFIGALFLTVAILAALVLVVVGLIYSVGAVA